jgi:hypothetical protein
MISASYFTLGVACLLLDIVKASDDANDPVDLLEVFDGIGPYIFALVFVIFSLHLLVQPNWAMIDLMKTYLDEGSSISGTVLDCEPRRGSTPNKKWLVEVMWECCEHKYADNPSMKFRNPDAFEEKRFARRFEFDKELVVGAFVPVILPRGTIQPRSGCPTDVVESILAQETAKQFHLRLILGVGAVLILGICGFVVRQIIQMDNPHHGWIVFLASVAAIECASLLFCADQFFKKKARVYDGARPMISVAEQQERRDREAAEPLKTAPPFSIPLHEFAGHARATERKR